MGRKKGFRNKNSIYVALDGLIPVIEDIIIKGHHTSTTIFKQLELAGYLAKLYNQGYKGDSIRRSINNFIKDKNLIVKNTPSYALTTAKRIQNGRKTMKTERLLLITQD